MLLHSSGLQKPSTMRDLNGILCSAVCDDKATSSIAMARLMKDLPGLITLPACCKVPIRDSNSLRVHDFRGSHRLTMLMRRCSLSVGRQSCPIIVSTSIPKNVSMGLGPAFFSGARGTPNSLHSLSILSRLCWHTSDPGGPRTIYIIIQVVKDVLYAASRDAPLQGVSKCCE